MQPSALFDVDGTLAEGSAGNMHMECFDEAFRETLGIKSDIAGDIDYEGKVDLQLIQENARIHKIRLSEKQEKEIMSFMSDRFEERIKKIEVGALPGSKDFINYLSNETQTLLGLVTGNLPRIAYAKIEKIGLMKYFDKEIEGFGNMSNKRYDLVRIAYEKAVEIAGNPVEAFIIDDTPRGAEAAMKANTKCISVMSGKYKDPTEFQKFKPLTIINSLEEIDRIKSYFV